MTHIVCITGGLTGLLNASLALVEQLQQAGYRVTYASPANLYEPVTAQGIPYVQLDRWVMQSGDPPMSRWAKLQRWQERQQRAVDALGVQRFVPMMQALAPDLLLMDIEMHPHIMAAVMAQLPVALLCPFLSIWKRPQLPPIHTGILPGDGWRGQRLGIEWSWLRYGWTKWQESQRDRWRRLGLDGISVLRCYGRQIGYPWQSRSGLSQWLVPYPHGNLPILCLNALELDLPHDPHPWMHYLGPMVSQQRQEPQVDAATRTQLEQIFAHRQASGRPLIYCGCSSLAKADRRFLQQIVAVASSCPQWDWVIGLGGKLQPRDLGPLPPHVHGFHWAPQLQVLKQADCAIINSGINSLNECIDCGVPMLVYSLKCADQNGNAVRVAYHDLGIVGDRTHLDTQMSRHLHTLLTDPSYRTRVLHMGDRFHRYAREKQAVQVVEALLRSHQTTAKGNLASEPAVTPTSGLPAGHPPKTDPLQPEH